MSPTEAAGPWPGRAARWCAIGVLLVVSACGGGGSNGDSGTSTATTTPADPSTPGGTTNDAALAANQVKITVDGGTDGSAINSPFVQVTVCTLDGATCRTVDHVLLDTGSYGLRVAATALGSLASTLPAVRAPDGNALAECAGFVSGFTWGSVRTAEVRMADQSARNLPVQVVNDTASVYAGIPADCSTTGADLGTEAGTNGILGLGFLAQDCGADCAVGTAPGMYFSCSGGGCVPTVVPLASQVTNPVAQFAVHNNGLAIQLPAVAAGGVASLGGTLTFGVGTASNNQVGSGQVFAADDQGSFSTVYQGRTLSGFLDSGSNGIFFRDRTIPSCASGFYCPSSTLSLSATVSGSDGRASRSIAFTVESAARLSASVVAAHLGGDIGLGASFDWGLPFFFDRTVFLALRGAATPVGTGPFWAF